MHYYPFFHKELDMNPLIVLVWFALCIAGTYVGMRTICFLKKEYSQAENWVLKGIIGVISFFEEICAGCKKGCEEHPVLMRRALRVGIFIWAVSTATWFLAHC